MSTDADPTAPPSGPSSGPPSGPSSAPPSADRPRRRPLRTLAWAALAVALLVAAGSALTAWLWQSTRGVTTVVAVLDRLLPARLTVTGATGSFADGFGFDELVYDAPTLTVRVQRLRATLADVQLGLSLGALGIAFDELSADALTVRLRPSDTPSTGLPTSIASPLRVSARRLAIGAFELATGADPSPTRLAARSIDAGVAIGPDGYRVSDGRFAFGPAQSPLQAELAGTLAGAPPFAVDARGRLLGRLPGHDAQNARGTLRSQPMSAALVADGSLVQLRVRADVQPVTGAGSGPSPRGALQARIAAFEPPALRELVADLQDIDPADWVDGAPTARLSLHAELVPQPGERFVVRGPVRVSNALAGPVDTGRLPLRAATAQVEASAAALQVTDIEAQLSRGSARGSFAMDFARLDAWRAQAQFSGVDPATIHTRVRALSLDGRADVLHEAGDTAVTGQLRNRAGLPVEATVDLRASARRLLVNTAQLRLGSGQAMLAGELQFDGTRAARVAGSVVEFDPSLLVAGIDARLTGTLNVDGVLAPQPAGTAAFGLAESQAFGRPLVGHGVLTLDAAGRLDVDATLGVRSATLTARGGLGGDVIGSAEGDRSGERTGDRNTAGTDRRALTLSLSAPQLRELGLPLAGRVQANARLTGDWQAPAVELQAEAGRLIWGEHRVEEMQAVASYSGGRDGAVALQATASNHRFQRNPTLSLASATLRADGRLADHRIELRANNEEAQPLAALIVGGWQRAAAAAASGTTARAATGTSARAPAGASKGADAGAAPGARAAAGAAAGPASSTRPEWRGELRSATLGRPLDLTLLAPAPIRTDFSRWSIGPVDMQLAGARVDEVRVDLAEGVLTTSGRFADFRPSAMRGGSGSLIAPALLQPGTLTPGNGSRAGPIALRGQWQLRLGTQADGSVLIERSGGDIEAAGTTMGITALRLEATVRANRLQASARMLGERAGRLEAQLAADVERSSDGWRLAQQRPLAASLEADLPSIAWFNALLSEAVRGNVRLGGAVTARLTVDGTPAEPTAQGSINGERLRVAWIDQGIRLENGTLAARVDGGSIVLDELRFAGGPQVRPGDRRPIDALAKDNGGEPGFLSMNGRLTLRDLSGVLQVQAVRVPFLQRVDRWVVATGGANIVFDSTRVQLNGAVLANAGFVDFSRPNLPSLSSDVQVIRANAPANGAGRDAPIGLNFDLGIDLGPAFYLRGQGIDTQIEGQLRLRAEGRGAIRATGAVETQGGVYEGFGQRLAIQRGRVNFQGPLENPGLDILAVRRGLPVEVGVSITRTAQNPLIKLYSDQAMPDYQILSWLVLGRVPDETGQDRGADRAAMATAAAGLLSGSGEGLTTQLARRLGIDDISLRSSDGAYAGSLLPRSSVAGTVRGTGGTAAGDIVSIGKRLSDNITVSYEQALAGTASLVQISYQLTQRLSVLARAGTENALDLVYSFAFD